MNAPAEPSRSLVLGTQRQRSLQWRETTRSLLLREASLGIVYETDARVEPDVNIVGYFPPDSYPSVIYPFAATRTAKPEAADYLEFLESSASRDIRKGRASLPRRRARGNDMPIVLCATQKCPEWQLSQAS